MPAGFFAYGGFAWVASSPKRWGIRRGKPPGAIPLSLAISTAF